MSRGRTRAYYRILAMMMGGGGGGHPVAHTHAHT